jgi:hypothetical protein
MRIIIRIILPVYFSLNCIQILMARIYKNAIHNQGYVVVVFSTFLRNELVM